MYRETNGLTDRQSDFTKLIGAFHSFVNMPRKSFIWYGNIVKLCVTIVCVCVCVRIYIYIYIINNYILSKLDLLVSLWRKYAYWIPESCLSQGSAELSLNTSGVDYHEGNQQYINQTLLMTSYVALLLMYSWIPWWYLLLQQVGNYVVNRNRIHAFSVLWWYEFWISLMQLFMNAVLTL